MAEVNIRLSNIKTRRGRVYNKIRINQSPLSNFRINGNATLNSNLQDKFNVGFDYAYSEIKRD